MIQAPYAFVKSVGAVIGGLGDAGAAGTVCGNQLHLDSHNKPWWWNGGILRDKNQWEDRYMKFTHFAEGEDWEFSTSCIKEKNKIKELTLTEREIGAKLIALDKKRKGIATTDDDDEQVEQKAVVEEDVEAEEDNQEQEEEEEEEE